MRDVLVLALEERMEFIDKVEKVRRFPFRRLLYPTRFFAKACPIVDSQDAKFVTAVRNACDAAHY